MSEVEAIELRKAVERMHTCKAKLAQSVPVRERHGDVTVWEGVVHVFDLKGHLTDNRAYAWSSPVEGSDKRRFFAAADYLASGGRAGGYRGRASCGMKRARGIRTPNIPLGKRAPLPLGYRRTSERHRNAAPWCL